MINPETDNNTVKKPAVFFKNAKLNEGLMNSDEEDDNILLKRSKSIEFSKTYIEEETTEKTADIDNCDLDSEYSVDS